MGESEKLAHSTLINDSSRTVYLDVQSHNLHHFVYVDNLGVLAMTEKEAMSIMCDLQILYPARGLRLHEASCASDRRECLGTVLDCSRHLTALTAKRFFRLHSALRALLRRRRASGKAIEIIIGHCTFCALIDRRLLSIFQPLTNSFASVTTHRHTCGIRCGTSLMSLEE
jgi:hypothetical protein